MEAIAGSLSNPLNMLLLAILCILAFQYIVPANPNSRTLRPTVAHARLRMDPNVAYSALPPEYLPSTVWNRYTPRTLAVYDGTDKSGSDRILLAINGKVFDVSSGRNFYGPDGPYGNFAGRDASRGMAKQSFDLDMLTPLDQPLDTLADLTPAERTNMHEWEAHFTGKYGVVGELVNEDAI